MRSLLALAFMATAAHAQVDISQAPCAYPNGVLAAPNYFSFAGTVPAGKELNAHRLDAHSDTLGAGGQSRVAGSVLSGSGYAFRLTKDGNIFIGDLSLDQYIDARVHAALGH